MSAVTGIRVAIGADHAGFELKEQLRALLRRRGYACEDCGTFDGRPADYPAIAYAVASRISDGRADRGIIVDGAGIGSAIAANKVPGVRAALCYDVSSARNSREHNDANVLTLGARLIGSALAEQIVEVWLTTDCREERHLRRVAMIEEIERGAGMAAQSRGHATQAGHATPTAARSEENPTVTDIPAELSADDISRIAERIQKMMADQGVLPVVGACSCCGADCNGRCAEQNPDTVRGLLGMGAGRIGHRMGGGPLPRDIAGYIDHTALKPETTPDDIRKLCAEAAEYGFATVCINPCYVRLAAESLRGSPVRVCSVAGFPLGAVTSEVKAMEARRAIREGAREIDMVINVGVLKGRDDEYTYRDIRAVVEACEDGRAICKVIIEAALLTDDEKVRACLAAKRARADFVKTSTGFGPGGATAHDVAIMSRTVAGTRMGVKAAGGIRSFEEARKMIEAGATRIGASAGIQIVKEALGAPAATGGKPAEKY
jgi:deoxyribose-phosphate aldolase